VGYWFETMPVTRAHVAAGFALFATFVFESWEMMILIFNSASIGAEFGLDTADLGSLISALFLGMIPGALLWGKLADKIGRKRAIILSFVLYSPLPLLCAMAPDPEVLWWLRFVCGLVLSGALVITFPYFEELVPVKVRGKATVYLSAGWPVGLLVAIALTWLLSDLGWRWVIGFSSVSLFWALAILRWVPESPYWLAEQGRTREADAVIAGLSRGRLKPASKPGQCREKDRGSRFLDIFRHPATRITVLQTVINFCFSWGYWALTSWMPALLAQRGLSTPEGLGFIALSAVFMFPGYITASFLTGRFGRKPVMLVFVAIAALAGFGFARSSSVTEMYAWNFTLSFFSLGAWGVWNTWMGEIYITQIRGAGVAWGVSMQRVANALAPVVIGAMLATSSFLQIVSFISAFLAATFVTAIFLPETEGEILH
jgi:putative MFS transporter